MLESEGFVVVGEAPDGSSALRDVTELEPDVVLLDVQLPDMTGFDVCDALRRRDGEAPLVVLVSSRDECEYGELVRNCGAQGFIPKAELSGEAVAALLA